MKVIIKIGDDPTRELLDYSTYSEFYDDFSKEKKKMEDILMLDNITITNANQFLVYMANNMILRYNINGNKELPDDISSKPNLNPKNIEIIEQFENGKEKSIQNKDGLVQKNYFNILMEKVMDDYYDALYYYDVP